LIVDMENMQNVHVVVRSAKLVVGKIRNNNHKSFFNINASLFFIKI
jgi:hypothetical protein